MRRPARSAPPARAATRAPGCPEHASTRDRRRRRGRAQALWRGRGAARRGLRPVPRATSAGRVRTGVGRVARGEVEAGARRKPGALPGGQQRRGAPARAIGVEPRVLPLDEPLSNLDAKVRQRLRAEVRRLQRRVGITTVYVTHDQEEALAIADRVVLMSAGRVVQAGSPQDLYLTPVTEFAADFLGVGTRLPARAEPGGLVLDETKQRLPYAGDARGPVVIVLRSSDLTLGETGPTLEGDLEESLFLGDR